MRCDIVILADLCFPGGSSTAAASEIRAAAQAGYRIAVIAAKSPVLKAAHPIHPEIENALALPGVTRADAREPIEARLLAIHHPQLLTHLPVRPLAIEAEKAVLIAHHPPENAKGEPYWDVRRIVRHARIVAGGEVVFAPVGPKVRTQLERARAALGSDDRPTLSETDWFNILDPTPFRPPGRSRARGRDRLVIGRHSRPDRQKWPESRERVLLAYPDDPAFEVRILGGGPFLNDLMEGAIPANWRVAPFEPGAAPDFLHGLDLFVYHHHPDWIEAFGRTIAEAMAARVPVILPPDFEDLFEDGARYASLEETAEEARALGADPSARAALIERADRLLEAKFSPRAYRERIAALIGPPEAPRPARARAAQPRMARAAERVMFMTSNGVGLGHLTRAMAIARRLGPGYEPVFLTLSQAASVVHAQGFFVEFTPFHGYLGVDHRRWNHFLRLEIEEFLAYWRPSIALFDGNVPYGGMVSALEQRPEIWRIWIRRGMWRPGSGRKALAVENRFDWVIEPDDLASSIDQGPTRAHRARTHEVGPIRFHRPCERRSREEARRALELPEDGLACLIQLGSGNNFDFRPVIEQLAAIAAKRPEIAFVAIDNPIAEAPIDPPPVFLRRAAYPLGPLLPAFDLAIGAVGYNAFHELIGEPLPTLFVANENPMMDDQRARALWAERAGLALAARADDPFEIDAKIAELLEPETRAAIDARARRLTIRDGAEEAAAFVRSLAATARADVA